MILVVDRKTTMEGYVPTCSFPNSAVLEGAFISRYILQDSFLSFHSCRSQAPMSINPLAALTLRIYENLSVGKAFFFFFFFLSKI